MNILVYFTAFSSTLGGSEYLPLLFIAELQKNHNVVLAPNWKFDIGFVSVC